MTIYPSSGGRRIAIADTHLTVHTGTNTPTMWTRTKSSKPRGFVFFVAMITDRSLFRFS